MNQSMGSGLILRNYTVYVMFFLGMGLISGSIVHMPIDPGRYSMIMAVGVIVFVVASILNEIVVERKQLTFSRTIRLVFFSLLLSLGIGMMSGGIQHFEDVKEYASVLIPVGFGLSLFSFIFKNDIQLNLKKATVVVAAFLVVVVPLKFGLDYLVHNTEGGTGHGGHGHGVEETVTTPTEQGEKQPSATQPETKSDTQPATQPATDGHGEHGGSHH